MDGSPFFLMSDPTTDDLERQISKVRISAYAFLWIHFANALNLIATFLCSINFKNNFRIVFGHL